MKVEAVIFDLLETSIDFFFIQYNQILASMTV
jgi:hypothetical protein